MNLTPINNALSRPMLIGHVEKRLVFANLLMNFLVLASCHLHLLTAILSAVLFVSIHIMLIPISRRDPNFGAAFKRATRFLYQTSYRANSHPEAKRDFVVPSVTGF